MDKEKSEVKTIKRAVFLYIESLSSFSSTESKIRYKEIITTIKFSGIKLTKTRSGYLIDINKLTTNCMEQIVLLSEKKTEKHILREEKNELGKCDTLEHTAISRIEWD